MSNYFKILSVIGYIYLCYCVCSPIIAWFIVQMIKVIVEISKNKRIDVRRLWGSGGMPSSHSAVATSLATLIGCNDGFDSPLLAIAAIFACVVMYDAAGVRRAAGKQAKLLNKIVETPGLSNVEVTERLVEVLDHTPFQVLVGAIIGILVGFIFKF